MSVHPTPIIIITFMLALILILSIRSCLTSQGKKIYKLGLKSERIINQMIESRYCCERFLPSMD